MEPIQAVRAVTLSLLFASSAAMAQSYSQFTSRIPQYADLNFPTEAKTLSFFSSVSNAIFKPEGDGPFPAVVLVHTCGGIQPHLSDRAKELIAAGFVVLVQDSYGTRGHTTFCTAAGVGAPRVYKSSIHRAFIWSAYRWAALLRRQCPARKWLAGSAQKTASAPQLAGTVPAPLT